MKLTPVTKVGLVGIAIVAALLANQQMTSWTKYLASLPIQGAKLDPKLRPVTATAPPAELYALLVRGHGDAAGTGDVPLDAAIGGAFAPKKVPEVPVVVPEPVKPPPPPDPTAHLHSMARLNAISDGGAVINGRFVALGEAVELLAYADNDGTRRTPVLQTIAGTYVVLSAATSQHGVRQIKMGLPE